MNEDDDQRNLPLHEGSEEGQANPWGIALITIIGIFVAILAFSLLAKISSS